MTQDVVNEVLKELKLVDYDMYWEELKKEHPQVAARWRRHACGIRAERGQEMRHWRKYAAVIIDPEWPVESISILEPACIALGGFSSGGNFNINYFDHAAFRSVATGIEVLEFWCQMCLESLAKDDNGAIVRHRQMGRRTSLMRSDVECDAQSSTSTERLRARDFRREAAIEQAVDVADGQSRGA